MAVNEGLVLDTLDLNDGTTYSLEALSINPAKKRFEWQTGGDSDGGVLSRDALYENREIVARVRVAQQATQDLALAKIALIADKLEEAERNQTGVALQWTPADGTLTTGTFRCLAGEITDLPVTVQGDDAGWFVKAPVVTVTMTCDPFMRGPEVLAGTTSASTLPVVTLELTSVAGDAPAEGRLVVTDAASQSRRLVRWGIESRFYPTSSPPGLILDSDSLTAIAGTGGTRTGAYDPGAAGNSVIRASLAPQAVAVCSTGVQAHVGTFHVFARVWAAAAGTVGVRLTWQDGDGPLRSNPYVTPSQIHAFSDIDLGTITISTVTAGTQKWLGRIDAYSSSTTDTLDVDYIYLIPAQEGYGEARGVYSFVPGTLVARDEFTSITVGTVLNARTAPAGGTWATSGVATDFTAADAPGSAETETRATGSEASRRLAILGATNYTDTEVGADVYATGSSAVGNVRLALVARYVDASNYLLLNWDFGNGLYVSKRVAGTETNLMPSFAADGYTGNPDIWYKLRLVVFASGAGIAWLLDSGGGVIDLGTFADAVLATGGALATGKPGFADWNFAGTATARYYDNFYAATPAAEQVVVYSGRTATFASTYAQRLDSTGTYSGAVPGDRGSRFYVPVAGTRARKARIAVVARRNDVVVNPDDQIADSTTIQAYTTPRYINVPR